VDFDVSADAYGRFMGRFSEPLAEQFLASIGGDLTGRALDVGCGPGALTSALVARLGADHVAAIDPSESFVAAVRQRLPGVDVRTGRAESLPFRDDAFDVALAQLVVHFMADPVAGLREMARVTRPGGTVAASVWDHAGGAGPLALFWRTVTTIDPSARDEADLPGAREGDLARIAGEAGLSARSSQLQVSSTFESFEQWWEPFTLGVGPAGAYVAGLDDRARLELQEHLRAALPSAPFDVTASAWCVIATAPT
jgi:SAM-dependent methyltransferase